MRSQLWVRLTTSSTVHDGLGERPVGDHFGDESGLGDGECGSGFAISAGDEDDAAHAAELAAGDRPWWPSPTLAAYPTLHATRTSEALKSLLTRKDRQHAGDVIAELGHEATEEPGR